MPIVTLPVFEAEADPKTRGLSDEDVAVLDRLRPPETVVVRYGSMRHIAELPCQLNVVLGCGEKLVCRTPRGTELAEMLTTTCANAGCGKSLTRKEMLTYIEQSGGRSYPFTTHGRVLRQATPEDLNAQAQLEAGKKNSIKRSRQLVAELSLEMRIVEVEPILGQEQLTFYYTSEDRVDFRELVRMLASEFATRIEMRQVGARDEARLVADYERCGQHCCCRQFLKVLKPVSMRSAKMQKATLDPLKISGRCGRLMCCLRYEDQTYQELKKNLPHRRTRVGTPEGPGLVIDTQILTQLVLVELEHNQARIAVPIEELMDPDLCPPPAAVTAAAVRADPLRGVTAKGVIQQVARQESQEPEVSTADAESKRRHRKRRGRSSPTIQQEQYRQRAEQEAGRDSATTDQSPAAIAPTDGGAEMSETSTGEREAELLRSGKGDEADSGPQQITGAEQIDKRPRSRRRRRGRKRNTSSAPGAGDGVAHTPVSDAPASSIPSDSQGASAADLGAAATSDKDQIPDHITAQTETDLVTSRQPDGKKRRKRRRKRKSDRSPPNGGGTNGTVNSSGGTGSAG